MQKLVQSIGADQVKLKTYCDIGKLQDQMEQAEQKKDTKTIAALGAKADNLGKQLGPDYEKVMAGLEQIDPSSAEGKRYTALFQPRDHGNHGAQRHCHNKLEVQSGPLRCV